MRCPMLLHSAELAAIVGNLFGKQIRVLGGGPTCEKPKETAGIVKNRGEGRDEIKYGRFRNKTPP